MTFPLLTTKITFLGVLFFATAVHTYDHSPILNNYQQPNDVVENNNTGRHNHPGFLPQHNHNGNNASPAKRNDAVLPIPGTPGISIEAFMEERQQQHHDSNLLPKPRGKKSLAIGLMVMLSILLYLAVYSKEGANNNVQNNLIDVLKNPSESLSTKAEALRLHILDPAVSHPQSTLLFIVYAAALALSISGLLEYMKTKAFVSRVKLIQKELITLPQLPPDVRPRNLGIAGALLAGISAVGLALNVHPALFYFLNVGVALLGAGSVLLIAKILQSADTESISIPEMKHTKAKQSYNKPE